MGNLYIALFHHSILQCGIYPPMTEKLLKLLNRHTFVDCHSSQCASELVRVCLLNVQAFTDFSDSYLYTADFKSLVWGFQRYEKSFIIVCPAVKILLQMQFGTGIKIDDALFIALAENNALTLLKINIGTV